MLLRQSRLSTIVDIHHYAEQCEYRKEEQGTGENENDYVNQFRIRCTDPYFHTADALYEHKEYDCKNGCEQADCKTGVYTLHKFCTHILFHNSLHLFASNKRKQNGICSNNQTNYTWNDRYPQINHRFDQGIRINVSPACYSTKHERDHQRNDCIFEEILSAII